MESRHAQLASAITPSKPVSQLRVLPRKVRTAEEAVVAPMSKAAELLSLTSQTADCFADTRYGMGTASSATSAKMQRPTERGSSWLLGSSIQTSCVDRISYRTASLFDPEPDSPMPSSSRRQFNQSLSKHERIL